MPGNLRAEGWGAYMGDYIKIYRTLMEWEWYKNINTKTLFLHMLLKANWKDGKFQGEDIPRGSFVSSLQSLSSETSLSIREVRTAISHLEKTGELTVKRHAKFSVFTIKNYSQFQTSDTQATSNRHTSDKQATTIEEKKERKKERNNIYTYAFEEFWKVYPRKKDKGNAFKKFNARLNSGFSEVELIGAAKKYALDCESNMTPERYIKVASTFLGDATPFVDYLPENDSQQILSESEDEEELVGDDW